MDHLSGLVFRRPQATLTADLWSIFAPPFSTWTCDCGKTTVPLVHARAGLHGFLGQPRKSGEPQSKLSFVRVYERGSLSDACAEFAALIDGRPREEVVQSFLEVSPVFLHRLSPTSIKPKAPVLTRFVTDFAVLDSRGVLYLIEIERPSLPLLKKDGEMTQKLQHAFEQVRSWLDVCRRRWSAVLDCMGFTEQQVATFRGIVVAGRNGSYSTEHLMRLKGADHGPIDFYTYDDLLDDTIGLARQL